MREAATLARDRSELSALAVPGAVRTAARALDPSTACRVRMRDRALSGTTRTARPPAEPTAEPTPAADSAPGRRAGLRVVAAALAGLLAVGTFLGAAAGSSRPGDAFFGLRDAGERVLVAVSTVRGDSANGELAVAGRRLDDVGALLGGGRDDRQRAAVTTAVDGAVAHLEAASRAATGAAVAGASDQLVSLHDWALARTWQVAVDRSRADGGSSADLDRLGTSLLGVVARTEALAGRLTCRQITADTDELGPVPAGTDCAAGPGTTSTDIDGLRTLG